MSKREIIQKEAIGDILDAHNSNHESIYMAELGTGTGKTKILIDVAKSLLEKNQSPILISTANNTLVLEYVQSFASFAPDVDIEVFIGKSNYVDPASFTQENIDILNHQTQTQWTLDDFRAWMEASSFGLLEEFMDYFAVPEDTGFIFGYQDSEEENFPLKTRIDDLVANKKIYITNHSMLSIMYLVCKAEHPIFTVPVLLDEVHTLHDCAQSLLTKSFSFFRLKYSFERFSTILTKKSDKKSIDDFLHALNVIHNNKSDKQPLSTFEEDSVAIQKLRTLASHPSATAVKTLFSHMKTTPFGSLVDTRIYNIAKKEFQELFAVNAQEHISVTYSAIKLFPSFTTINLNIGSTLRGLWAKNKSFVCGVSGTLQISETTTKHDNAWSFERIGFMPFSKFTDNATFEATDSQEEWNERLALNFVFKVYGSIFEKDQMRYYIFGDEKYLYPTSQKISIADRQKMVEEWTKHIAEAISEARYGNMLVLVGSTSNALMIKEHIEADPRFDDYVVFSAEDGKSMRTTQKQHMNAVDDGKKAITIGNMTFFTGLDMPNNYINTLFVSKLPYEPLPPALAKIKVGYRKQREHNLFKAILMFRQGIGRGIRTPNDKVLVVVSDPRILKENGSKKGFMHFLNKMGTPVAV